MNNNAYGFNPAWNPTQQAAYAAQFGGAYMPQFGAGMPAGGGGIGGMGGGMFGGMNNPPNNPPNNMHGGGGGVGVGPIPPGFANAFHAMNVGAAGGGGGLMVGLQRPQPCLQECLQIKAGPSNIPQALRRWGEYSLDSSWGCLHQGLVMFPRRTRTREVWE